MLKPTVATIITYLYLYRGFLCFKKDTVFLEMTDRQVSGQMTVIYLKDIGAECF